MTVKELKEILENINEDLVIFSDFVDLGYFGEITSVNIDFYKGEVICDFIIEEE